jgi:biopolymer transport protein ExbD
MVISAGYELSNESDTDAGTLMGLLVIFSITCFISMVGTIRQFKKRKKEKAEKRERKILTVIARKGGKVTPFEIASETRLSYEESKAVLDRLCESGAAQLQLTPDGHTLYVFTGVIDMQQKSVAKNLLDF